MNITSTTPRTVRRRRCAAAALTVGLAAAAAITPGAANADQQVGAFMVMGRIETSFFATGGTASWGPPTTPELPDRRGGRLQKFDTKATSFYFSPTADGGNAHQVGGAIRDFWGSKGWETGPLGYPVSDERRQTRANIPALNWQQVVLGAYNDFQGGSVYWSPSTGVHAVWGEIKRQFDTAGGIAKIGYPTSDETRTPDGKFSQQFQNATITWP